MKIWTIATIDKNELGESYIKNDTYSDKVELKAALETIDKPYWLYGTEPLKAKVETKTRITIGERKPRAPRAAKNGEAKPRKSKKSKGAEATA